MTIVVAGTRSSLPQASSSWYADSSIRPLRPPYGFSVSKLGRRTLVCMIPLNVLLILWVWFGRIAFGVGGWFLLIFAVTIIPVIAVALLVTTILAFTQPGRPRSLTRVQAWAQISTWLGMLAFGAVVPDFGDTDDSEISALTQLLGRSRALLDLSYTLGIIFAVFTVVSFVVLLVTLTGARRRVATPEVAAA